MHPKISPRLTQEKDAAPMREKAAGEGKSWDEDCQRMSPRDVNRSKTSN